MNFQGQFQLNLGAQQVYKHCKKINYSLIFIEFYLRDLSYNEISGTIPTQLQNLANLQTL